MNDSELLDAVIAGFGLKNDLELSRFLGVTPGNISHIRQHKQDLGLLQKLKILDKIAYLRVSNWVERVSPAVLSKLIRQTNQAMTNRRVKIKPNAQYIEDAELVVLAKEGLGFNTDGELANYLDLSKSGISGIKSGRSPIGVVPRIKILERLEPTKAKLLYSMVSNSEALSDEITKFAQNQTNRAAL